MHELHPYQKEGVEWLSKRKVALLGDDMGLGKTAQVITACDVVQAENILIICPAIAKINWQREFEEWSIFTRDFKILRSYSDDPTGNCIASYEYLVKCKDKFANIKFDVVIFDECHYLKQHSSLRTKRALGRNGIIRQTKRTWALSGTPAPNNASELWVWLYTFGVTKLTFSNFIERYCTYYKSKWETRITGTNMDTVIEVNGMMKNIMLRRTKDQVMIQLPSITFKNIYVEPGAVDLSLHQSTLKYVYPIDRSDKFADKILLEEEILKNYLFEKINQGTNTMTGFNNLGDSVSSLRKWNGLQKIEAAIKTIDEDLGSGKMDKLVVFAIHRDVINFLFEYFKKKYKARQLYGGTSEKNKQKHIDEFQNDPKHRLLICNITAAGTAINLTASHNVLFVELDWVPGNNSQAIMRCHRIGQENNVLVRTLHIANSIDERVQKLIIRKTSEISAIY